jgi:hypothetical protein
VRTNRFTNSLLVCARNRNLRHARGERDQPQSGLPARRRRASHSLLSWVSKCPLSDPGALDRSSQWPEDRAAGLVESLLRNMHVPEILFNTYTPVPEDLWYTAIKAKSVIEPEGSAPLPAGFDETWSADEVETNPKLAAALARGDLVPRDVWNCADGKQRMSSIKRCVSCSSTASPNYDSVRTARRRELLLSQSCELTRSSCTGSCAASSRLCDLFLLACLATPGWKKLTFSRPTLETVRRRRHPLHVRLAPTASAQSAR